MQKENGRNWLFVQIMADNKDIATEDINLDDRLSNYPSKAVPSILTTHRGISGVGDKRRQEHAKAITGEYDPVQLLEGRLTDLEAARVSLQAGRIQEGEFVALKNSVQGYFDTNKAAGLINEQAVKANPTLIERANSLSINVGIDVDKIDDDNVMARLAGFRKVSESANSKTNIYQVNKRRLENNLQEYLQENKDRLSLDAKERITREAIDLGLNLDILVGIPLGTKRKGFVEEIASKLKKLWQPLDAKKAKVIVKPEEPQGEVFHLPIKK